MVQVFGAFKTFETDLIQQKSACLKSSAKSHWWFNTFIKTSIMGSINSSLIKTFRIRTELLNVHVMNTFDTSVIDLYRVMLNCSFRFSVNYWPMLMDTIF